MATWGSLTESAGESDADADDGSGYNTSGWITNQLIVGNDGTYSISFGIRWTPEIPQGATINSATVRLTAQGNCTGTATNIHCVIYGDDVDNAGAWSTGNIPGQVTETTANTHFDPTSWLLNDSVDLVVTDQIQEIVNREGWASGNGLRLAFEDESTAGTNYLRAYAKEDDYGAGYWYRPHLYVDYTEAVTAQFARPAADRTDGNWLNQASSNTDLFESINETSALLSDTDYIQSGASPSSDTCVIDLSSIATPQAGTVTLRVRAKYV